MPYMVGRRRKAPAGVVRSPSCFCLDVPRSPSHAVHGPATGCQQALGFLQSRNDPSAHEPPAAATVISWRAAPVEASWFARLGGHETAARWEPAADAASASGRQAASAIHLIVRAECAR